MKRTAVLSLDGRYRYQLGRHWDASKPVGAFLMLNPSTADASVDDPTIRRCIGFAQQWGWGGLRVVNLFAYRTASPAELWSYAKQHHREAMFGPQQEGARHLVAVLSSAKVIIAAWGSGPCTDAISVQAALGLPPRESWLRKMRALRVNKDGSPAHPLYLPASERPSLWRPRWA